MGKQNKLIFLYTLLGVSISLSAQETPDEKKVIDDLLSENTKEGWTYKKSASLLFNQAIFSNWVAGGENSMALSFRGDIEVNYKKDKNHWDNRFILTYGTLKNKGEKSQKQEDVFEINSKYSYSVGGKWFFATALNFKSQMTKGFDFDAVYNSNFMAPGYLLVGTGIDYKKGDNFQLSFHPIASKMTFINDPSLQIEDNYGLEKNGDSFIFEFGTYFGGRHYFELMNNISVDHRIGVYANYLDKPQNMDLFYQALLNFKVNKYVSGELSLELLYDEDQINKLQFKETVGLGISYRFGYEEEDF